MKEYKTKQGTNCILSQPISLAIVNPKMNMIIIRYLIIFGDGDFSTYPGKESVRSDPQSKLVNF